MPTWITALFPVLGVIVGASLQYYFSRSTEHRKRLHELRTSSYVDFLASVASNAVANRSGDDELIKTSRMQAADAKSRISLYGSTDVVTALAEFFRTGGTLSDQASIDLFVSVCRIMRSEACADSNVSIADISQLLVGAHCESESARDTLGK